MLKYNTLTFTCDIMLNVLKKYKTKYIFVFALRFTRCCLQYSSAFCVLKTKCCSLRRRNLVRNHNNATCFKYQNIGPTCCKNQNNGGVMCSRNHNTGAPMCFKNHNNGVKCSKYQNNPMCLKRHNIVATFGPERII